MKKFDGQMVRTKIEKFEAIKAIHNAQTEIDTELVEMCDNEIKMANNKASKAKSEKAKKQNETYAEALTKIMELFQTKPILFNDDIDFLENTSQKTKAFQLLMSQNKVVKCPKVKSKDKVSYKLATTEDIAE